MCGIIGYTGRKNALEVVLEGLHALEYRGYDSAGTAFFEDGGLHAVKAVGKVRMLEEKLRATCPTACPNVAVGHTRWATHGAPTDYNSHPHGNSRVQLVHNGIIENYVELKDELLAKGYRFTSETDTEVAALLIDETYLRTGSPKRAILEATSRMRGSYAFGILFADRPDTVYAIRRAAPLIVGLGEDENFIASDITAILSYTRRYIALGEDELAELTPERVHITDRDGVTVERTPQTALWEKSQAQKGGYPHFMKKEIAEEPQGVRSTLSPRVRDGLPDFTEEGLSLERLAGVRQLTVVACGTALHAGLLGADFARTLCRLPARCEIASEFRYADPILGPEDAVLLISQSGETADTLAALRLAKERGAYTVALINAVGSSIAREADTVLYTWAGPEIAVASTKAYTVQTSLLLLLMTRLGVARGMLTEEDARRITHQAMEDLPEAIAAILAREEEIATAAGQFARDAEHLFFIGRNVDYDCVTEASLKLKEISYIHSEAYAGGELKHGTISLIEEGTPVLALSTERALAEKLLGNVKEVASRGARVFAVVTAEDTLFERVSERVFRLPEMPDSIAPIAAATVFQLFAYHAAVMRGCPVDQPRNLAKSVTVE